MNNQDIKYTLTLKDLFTGKMSDAISQTKKMDSSVDSLTSKLKSLAIGVGLAGLIKGVIETGASFERAEVQLKTLLKSSVEAKAVFEDLKAESVKSPFSFETLLKGNAALISTGLSASKAKEDFNGLANAIAATGGGEDELQRMVFNLQQIKNVGATAQDIRQFGMAGINVYSLLDKYATKYKIKIDKHHITYEQIVGAFKLAGQAGGDYFNALNNLSNTTSGRLSNLKDSFQNFQDVLFNKLKPTINSIVFGLTSLMNFIAKHIDTISKLVGYVWDLVLAFAAYKAILYAVSFVQGVKFLVSLVSMSAGLQGATIAQYALNTAMDLCPVLALVTAFALLISEIREYKSLQELNSEGVQKNVNNGIADETKLVQDLAKGYEKLGYKKLTAQKKAIQESKKDLLSDIKTLQSEMNSGKLSESEMRIMNLRMGSAQGKLQALTDGSIFKDTTTGKPPKGEGADTSLGSGTEVTSARPQNLTINITKLVESLNITTQNMKEGSAKIKEMVSQALLESVNDVNLITK